MGLHFEVEREVFARALGTIQHLTQRRTLAPILSHVYVGGRDGKLELYATDFDMAVEKSIPAEIHIPGEVALPGRLLYEMVHRGKGQKILCQVDERFHAQLLLSDKSRYRLVGMDPSEFPPRQTLSDTKGILLKAQDLLRWLKKTLFAASTDESRAALSGVYLEVVPSQNTLCFVATDTHRLSLLEVPFPELKEGWIPQEGVIFPRRSLLELPRILEDDWNLELSFIAPYVYLKAPDTLVLFRTVEGKFPAYRNVIPQGGNRRVFVGRKEFLEALTRVGLLISDRFKGVRLTLEEGQITIHAHHPEAGEGTEVVSAEMTGPPIAVGFNTTYLQEPLGEIESERVEIRLSDESAPIVLLPEGDSSYLNVIMPMRL
jgi:DNA polymerase-3 subunit beta